jgi:uncharacterized protein involved in exopolysaccharide biosynthesis
MSVTNGKSTSGNGLLPGTLVPSMEGVTERNVAALSQSTTLEQLLLMLRRRWRLVVVCVLFVAGAAIIFSLLQRNEYTASASLLFRNTQFDQELFG